MRKARIRFPPAMTSTIPPATTPPLDTVMPRPAAGEAERASGMWHGGRAGLLIDGLLMLVVLLVAVFVRARFLSAGVPAFVTPDSDDYLWPGSPRTPAPRR